MDPAGGELVVVVAADAVVRLLQRLPEVGGDGLRRPRHGRGVDGGDVLIDVVEPGRVVPHGVVTAGGHIGDDLGHHGRHVLVGLRTRQVGGRISAAAIPGPTIQAREQVRIAHRPHRTGGPAQRPQGFG